jgi:hypothetical protein
MFGEPHRRSSTAQRTPYTAHAEDEYLPLRHSQRAPVIATRCRCRARRRPCSSIPPHPRS